MVVCVISAALFGAGIFYPNRPPNLASFVHGVCGEIVIGTFPIAATLYSFGLARSNAWMGSRRQLRFAVLLIWAGFLSFAGSIVVLLIITQPVDRSNASLTVGWQNRFMIATYALWLVAVTYRLAFPDPKPA